MTEWKGARTREPEPDEPSLGSATATINQEAWASGHGDLEQRRFREEPKKPSICNVVLVSGGQSKAGQDPQRSHRGNCKKRILHAWYTTYLSGMLVTVSAIVCP
jgi:hypothetical protein